MAKHTRIAAIRQGGFTLVGLITAISIVAILTMIAVPNYYDYMQRARRGEAKTALLRLATNQERFYFQNDTYTSDLTQLGFVSDQTESGNYQITVASADTLGFQATAVPTPGSAQVNDVDCTQFSIDDQSVRDATPDPKGDCW